MAKSSGLGDNAYVGGYDLSSDILAIDTAHGGPAAGDVTPINSLGYQRLGLLRDGGLDFTTALDPAALAEHEALSVLPAGDQIITYVLGLGAATQAIGNPAMCINTKQIDYDGTRAQNGLLTFKVSSLANGFGIEMNAVSLMAGPRTDTAVTVGAVYDNGAAGANGAQAYLQVFAFAGTDATVKVQHCATSGGVYADLATFAQTTGAPGAQRVTAAGSVNEFLKVTTVSAAGFSSFKFHVAVVVNPVAVAF